MKQSLIIVCIACFLSQGLVAQTKPSKNKNKETTAKKIKKPATVLLSPKEVVDTTPLYWFTDVMKADSVSRLTNKPIFGFFTGSDWCGWCHKLQREVFAKADFIKWAKEKVVLLELDFPRRKQLPQEQQQQNHGLAQAFQVQGYPTVWLFTLARDSANANNIKLNPLGSGLGYPSGATPGKEEVKFLENANAALLKDK